MDWLELHLDTSPVGIEPMSALLEQQGVEGLIIEDETDFHDFLENNHQYWDYVDEDLMAQKKGVSRITFYLAPDEEGLNTVANIRIAMAAVKEQHQSTSYRKTLLSKEGRVYT